jgi:aminomethyltransferase
VSLADTLRRTPLYDRHAAAGAKLVPFAGWEMPVQYQGIRQEHIAVRTGAGLFDVSHMGEIRTTGADAERFLQRILSNDVTKIRENGAQYSLLCNESGGVLDDLFTYRFDEGGGGFLTVTNASNHDKDLAWFQKQAAVFDGDVTVTDAHADFAMLALQGPDARAALREHLDGEEPKRMRWTLATVAGVPEVGVAGTGYTGEDGVELLIPPDGATRVWDALVGSGVTPAGLGARDTLRLEAAMRLWGNDIDESTTVMEAGMDWIVGRAKEDFIGRSRLREQKEKGLARRLVGFEMLERGIARHGYPVIAGDRPVGVVTSGTQTPFLKKAIGMAYVPIESALPGSDILIDIRGRASQARVVSLPFYKRRRTV